jgi:hypothetical protein
MKCYHCGETHLTVFEVKMCAIDQGDVMPKQIWSGLSSKMVDEAADSVQYDDYEGDLPTAGAYGWDLKHMKVAKSKQDNPMVEILWINDGERKPEFKGAPWFDNVTMIESTTWKIKQLCLAIGCSSDDFINKMVVDDANKVTKIGKLTTDSIHAKAKVKRAPNQDGNMKIEFAQYLPKKEGSTAEAAEPKAKKSKDDGGAAAAAEAAPASDAKKSKKGKKSKAAATDEPPF